MADRRFLLTPMLRIRGRNETVIRFEISKYFIKYKMLPLFQVAAILMAELDCEFLELQLCLLYQLYQPSICQNIGQAASEHLRVFFSCSVRNFA